MKIQAVIPEDWVKQRDVLLRYWPSPLSASAYFVLRLSVCTGRRRVERVITV